MYTGRDALSSIEQAISRARADESRLENALRSASDEAARMRREEAEGFRALARIKLDAMTRDKVISDLDATERQALAMIETHERATQDLTRRRDEIQATLDKAETAKHDADQALADALQALDHQRQRTADRMRTTSDWQAAKATVEAATKVAANADEKAALAAADLAAKRQPYEADPLFMYLWTRRHGQAEDTTGNLVRFFDRRIARLVGYSDARANYAMLQEIPTRLREHAQGKQQDVAAVQTQVATLERAALVADGAEALEAKVTTAEAAVKAGEREVLKITADLQAIEAERQKVFGIGDEGVYGGAVSLLADGLARDDLRQLYDEARRTPSLADDEAISAITKVRAAYEKADGEVARIRTSIRDMASRRWELESSRDRARSQGYEDPRGTFNDNNEVLDVIGTILGGVLRSGVLDRTLSDNHRSSGGSSWPGSWGGSSSSGSSGSDSSSSGGWRTGGSF